MDMNHGSATLRKDIYDERGNVLRKKGEVGIITAFLPEDDRFAVMFDECIGINNWFTLDRASFEEFFDYKLNSPSQPSYASNVVIVIGAENAGSSPVEGA